MDACSGDLNLPGFTRSVREWLVPFAMSTKHNVQAQIMCRSRRLTCQTFHVSMPDTGWAKDSNVCGCWMTCQCNLLRSRFVSQGEVEFFCQFSGMTSRPGQPGFDE